MADNVKEVSASVERVERMDPPELRGAFVLYVSPSTDDLWQCDHGSPLHSEKQIEQELNANRNAYGELALHAVVRISPAPPEPKAEAGHLPRCAYWKNRNNEADCDCKPAPPAASVGAVPVPVAMIERAILRLNEGGWIGLADDFSKLLSPPAPPAASESAVCSWCLLDPELHAPNCPMLTPEPIARAEGAGDLEVEEALSWLNVCAELGDRAEVGRTKAAFRTIRRAIALPAPAEQGASESVREALWELRCLVMTYLGTESVAANKIIAAIAKLRAALRIDGEEGV